MSAKNSTRKELELALQRIQLGHARIVEDGRKLSIAAVAEEAEVSPSLIHNSHPEFAKIVRELVGRPRRVAKDVNQEKLVKATERIEALTARVTALEEDLRKIAVENLSLSEDNKRLRQRLETLGRRLPGTKR
ncbi:TetR family transcriptional regulator [Pseudomonas profundi]|uniref:TetR family transcriptional regulator n=1 Tax=Pseudomonas profundi TaxID=1981513 RepID=UPI00123A5996|nr:TetR family transcriptional regulator [Pseudomonas profundi]